MRRTMLKSKIHRATLTGSDLNYVGSITVDADLLEAADIREHELVHVLDVDNGARFETYTIEGPPGSGQVQVNGAAARLVHSGDKVIVVSYASYDEAELEAYEPRVVHVDADNRVVSVADDPKHSASMPNPSHDPKHSASMPNPSPAVAELPA
ncbi:MAG: aspartate 1-decarboxylase [Thermoleophilaceae bacterium]